MQTYLKIVTIAIGAIVVLLLVQGVAGLLFQKVDEITSEEFDEVAVGADIIELPVAENLKKPEPVETYFAEIAQDGTVLRVIVADQAFIDSGAVGDPANWVQTFKGKNFISKGRKVDTITKTLVEKPLKPSKDRINIQDIIRIEAEANAI